MTKRNFLSGWYVWLFPVLAVVVSVTLFMSYWNDRGPTIKISFADASNIRVEKTKVRFRGVDIGTVKEIELSADGENAVVMVGLTRSAQSVAVVGSKFWMVTPKVDIQGVSGLETIFSGSYIAVDPGPRNGSRELFFKGQMQPGPGDSLENTVPFYLVGKNLGAISAGDPVLFRGVKVGFVSKAGFDRSAQSVLVQINVESRYRRLVRSNTAFWPKMGVQAKLGLFNSELKISALESLLRGGVEFSTPDQAGPMAKALSQFVLNINAPKNWEKWNPVLGARPATLR